MKKIDADRTARRPKTSKRIPRSESEASSWASTPAVRNRMRAQRTRDTAPEIALRKILHSSGLRYRVDRAPIDGMRRRADLVFSSVKVAVYVDGCFWHGCTKHRPPSKTNAEWWEKKLEGNRLRDADTDERLAREGWISVRVWEHEDPGEAAARVMAVIAKRRRDIK